MKVEKGRWLLLVKIIHCPCSLKFNQLNGWRCFLWVKQTDFASGLSLRDFSLLISARYISTITIKRWVKSGGLTSAKAGRTERNATNEPKWAGVYILRFIRKSLNITLDKNKVLCTRGTFWFSACKLWLGVRGFICKTHRQNRRVFTQIWFNWCASICGFLYSSSSKLETGRARYQLRKMQYLELSAENCYLYLYLHNGKFLSYR